MTGSRLPLLAPSVHGPRFDEDALAQAAACAVDDGCITCGDVAVVLEVQQIEGADAVCVDDQGRQESVAIDLVEVSVGARILVHARVALNVVGPDVPLGRTISHDEQASQ